MLQPSVWNETASYLRSFGAGNGQVEVANLVTGETKLAFRYTPDKLMNSVSKTVMGPRHVFWIYTGGLWARNLQTGEVKNLGGWCWSYCPTDTVVLCDDGDLSTKTTKRVTFDSPGAPRGKVYPAVRLIAIETGGSRGLVAVG